MSPLSCASPSAVAFAKGGQPRSILKSPGSSTSLGKKHIRIFSPGNICCEYQKDPLATDRSLSPTQKFLNARRETLCLINSERFIAICKEKDFLKSFTTFSGEDTCLHQWIRNRKIALCKPLIVSSLKNHFTSQEICRFAHLYGPELPNAELINNARVAYLQEIPLPLVLEIDQRGQEGKTPLHLACQFGDYTLISNLCNWCDANAKDSKGWTPLELLLLHDKKELESDPRWGSLITLLALHMSSNELLQIKDSFLIEVQKRVEKKQNPLHILCTLAEYSLIDYFISWCDPNQRDSDGRTTLGCLLAEHLADVKSTSSGREVAQSLAQKMNQSSWDSSLIDLISKEGLQDLIPVTILKTLPS